MTEYGKEMKNKGNRITQSHLMHNLTIFKLSVNTITEMNKVIGL